MQCMQVKTEMKRKVGKESEGGSKKRKEVGNESPLSSMFQKQQTANDLQKHESRIMQYLKRGNSWGWTRQRMPSLYTGQKTTHLPL